MKIEMSMPQMGESIAEATILRWLKSVGDKVEKDETILEISTDKVDSEIPAPASGVIVELRAKQGETVAVKSVIAVIDSEANGAKPAAKPAAAAEPAKAPAKAAPSPAPKSQPAAEDDRFYSPLVKSLAAQHNLSAAELAQIQGSGAQDRVTKSDVLEYLEKRGGKSSAPASETKSSRPAATTPPPPQFDYGSEGVRVEPMDKMRKLIAEHMVRSKHTSPHVYSMAEVDVTTITRWREANQKTFQNREGFKLSFTPFFLEAIVKALMQYPIVNASVDGENIVYKKHVNLGCAVALGTSGTEGLIVPVIKNADMLSFTGLASALNDIAQRARLKKLSPADVQGGTFTVTNPGIFGNIMGCPIINQPQLGILGIGAIKKRVMVVNDAIAIRDMVYLTLSYDHRVIDGSLGGHFLSYITKYLEAWDMDREV